MTTKEQNKKPENKEINKPLFTGDYRRDSAVSDQEKLVDAANTIWNVIFKKIKKQK